ncbi:hypothetical protein ACQ4WX_03845 [Streptomyces lasalocidi]
MTGIRCTLFVVLGTVLTVGGCTSGTAGRAAKAGHAARYGRYSADARRGSSGDADDG